jgi:hypothetical protein
MPAQAVLEAGALSNQAVAVVKQQPDLHRPLVQVGGGEALDAVLDDRAGDRLRVDLIRLTALALAAARGAHHLRRHPDDRLVRVAPHRMGASRRTAKIRAKSTSALLKASQRPEPARRLTRLTSRAPPTGQSGTDRPSKISFPGLGPA